MRNVFELLGLIFGVLIFASGVFIVFLLCYLVATVIVYYYDYFFLGLKSASWIVLNYKEHGFSVWVIAVFIFICAACYEFLLNGDDDEIQE